MIHLKPYISSQKYWFWNVFGGESSQLRWPNTQEGPLAQLNLIFPRLQIKLLIRRPHFVKESAAPGSVLESPEFSIWSISFPLHSCIHHILDLRRWLRKPASLPFLWEGRTPSMCEPSSPKGALVLLS